MYTYRKGPVHMCTISGVESASSVQIKFTYMIGFNDYRNRGITSTEDIWCNSSLGSYMKISPPQYKFPSLIELYYNSNIKLMSYTLILLPYI